MDLDRARADILCWVAEFVERPHPDLNGWPPCPYARQARLSNQIDIRAGGANLRQDLQNIDLGSYDVVAVVYDAASINPADFAQHINWANQEILVPKNIIALGDHPADPEIVNGVVLNQGTWAIIFVQALDKLNQLARPIAQKGYYQGWPENYLKSLFAHREDPRA